MFLDQPQISRTKREIKVRYRRKKWASDPADDDLESRFEISWVTLIEREETGREVESEEIVVKGNVAEGVLHPGLEYRLFGKWEDRPPHGWSFAYESFVIDKPATREAVCQYLRACKGIGSVRAGRLFDKYGESSIDILMTYPAKVAQEVSGLKVEDCEAAAELLKKSEHIRKSKLELIGVLTGKGFPRTLTDLILRDYGADAAEAVRRNPYLLMRYRSVGFLKTDKLYLEFGYDPSRLKRMALCAWHAIAKVSEGDTWFDRNQAITAIRKNVSGVGSEFQSRSGSSSLIDNARIDRAIKLAMQVDMLRVREGEMGRKWLAEGKKAAQEEKVARLIIQAMREAEEFPELIMWPDVETLNVYPHQKEELQKSIGQPSFICILAGSPGTGKTHSTAETLKQIIQRVGIDNVAACAPTGKAAVRMSEAFEKAGVDVRAMTIHSLLGVMSSEGGWTFQHNERCQLPFKFIVADEQSMVDVALMGSLLAARAKGCHILMVGDTNQLAPVGHGAPLRDLIAAGLPCGTLTEIQRTAGRAVKVCAEIRDHHRFTPSPGLDLANGENLVVLECDTADIQIETLEGLVEKLRATGKYDPVWDVQVLCMVNKKSSPLCRSVLNKKMQALLNPQGKGVAGNPFRVGDKVICLKNSDFQCVRTKAKVRVMNGEQGEVLSVEPTRLVVRLENPDREVIVLRSNKNADDEDNEQDARDPNNDDADDRPTNTGCVLDLGYAISVHKSQGSEWKVVAFMLDDSGPGRRIASRNLFYTGDSRFRVMGFLIGKESFAQEMCKKDGLKRKTFLKELILEGMKAEKVKWPAEVKAERERLASERVGMEEIEPFAWTEEVIEELLAGVM